MINIFKTLTDPVTKKRLNPLNDFFFKKMFGEKGCEELVSYLIEAILDDFPFQRKNNISTDNIKYNENNEIDMINSSDVDLENLNFLNPYINPDTFDKKGSILDVKVETDKFIIHIEAQIQEQANFGMRLFFYITRMFPKNLNKGKNYNMLKKIIYYAMKLKAYQTIMLLEVMIYTTIVECYLIM
jgi:hypothetical protein